MRNSVNAFALKFSALLILAPCAANATTAKAILDALHNPVSSEMSPLISNQKSDSSLNLAKLFDCAHLLTNSNVRTKTNGKNRLGAFLERDPYNRIVFSERDLMAEIVFVATNDDFYKLESIVLDEDGSHITIHGYLYKRNESAEPTEIDLFHSIDSSASPVISKTPNEFKKFVKVAELVNNDEFELKIKIETFTAEQVAAFLRALLEKFVS